MVENNKKNKASNDQITKIETSDLEIIHDYLERLWDFLPNPICDINGALIIINVDKSFLKFFGYKKEEIIGESIEKIFYEKEEFDSFKKELSKNEAISQKDFILVTNKGKIVPAAVFVSPKKVEGIIISYLVAFLDLSEIKEKEKQLQDKIKQLEFFQKLAEGRELKMVELKKEIEGLKKKVNQQNENF